MGGFFGGGGGGTGGFRELLTMNPVAANDGHGFNILTAGVTAAELSSGQIVHFFASGMIQFGANGNVDVDLDLSQVSNLLFPTVKLIANAAVVAATNSPFYADIYAPVDDPGRASGIVQFGTATILNFPSPNEGVIANVANVNCFSSLQDGPFAADLTAASRLQLLLADPGTRNNPAMACTWTGNTYIEILSPPP